MVEVTIGRRLSKQWRGALPASAAGAGHPRACCRAGEGGGAVRCRARGVRSRPGGRAGERGRGLGPD
jgi:hypothetical protein